MKRRWRLIVHLFNTGKGFGWDQTTSDYFIRPAISGTASIYFVPTRRLPAITDKESDFSDFATLV